MFRKEKGITREALAAELGVDRRAIYRYLNQRRPSLEHMVGICVALKLPFYISFDLIENGGERFRRTELHHLYRQFLLKADQLTVARCNDILKSRNYPPLFQGEDLTSAS